MLIDANLIPVFFNKENEKHKKYLPVLKWFISGKAKIVIGGGYYYKKEIAKNLCSYLALFKNLTDIGKTHFCASNEVDEQTDKIRKQETDTDFDDPHIIALLRISAAKIFCSEDERSFKFVKDKKFYAENQEIPKILSLTTHESSLGLLTDENICSKGEHKPLPEKVAKAFMEKWKLS
jgi:predicted nucleic acid-binding protein